MGRRSEGLEPEAWLFSMKGTNKNKYIIFVFIYFSPVCLSLIKLPVQCTGIEISARAFILMPGTFWDCPGD